MAPRCPQTPHISIVNIVLYCGANDRAGDIQPQHERGTSVSWNQTASSSSRWLMMHVIELSPLWANYEGQSWKNSLLNRFAHKPLRRTKFSFACGQRVIGEESWQIFQAFVLWPLFALFWRTNGNRVVPYRRLISFDQDSKLTVDSTLLFMGFSTAYSASLLC